MYYECSTQNKTFEVPDTVSPYQNNILGFKNLMDEDDLDMILIFISFMIESMGSFKIYLTSWIYLSVGCSVQQSLYINWTWP